MSFDPSRLEAGLWAAAGASIYAAFTAVAAILGIPPPDRRTVMRSLFEWVLAAPLGFLAGYGFGAPLAAFLDGFMPMKVDPVGAGILIGMFSVKGLTLAFDIVVNAGLVRLRDFIGGKGDKS